MEGKFSIFCLSFALIIVANMDCMAYEEDYSVFYNAAVHLLAEGDCVKAEQNYNTYKAMTGKSSSIIEKGIRDCKGRDAKNRTSWDNCKYVAWNIAGNGCLYNLTDGRLYVRCIRKIKDNN